MRPGFLRFLLLPLAATYVLAQTAAAPKKATLTVHVVNATTGEPVRKAVLVLRKGVRGRSDEHSAPSFSGTTDADGHFTFDAVEPGSYRLSVHREGFMATQYVESSADSSDSGLVLNPGQTLDVNLKAVPLCVISGRVLDADGDALVGARVSAIRVSFSNGKREIQRVGRETTNDRGEYRFYDLPPGRYYIAVWVGKANSGDLESMIYYPSATGVNDASLLNLAPGNTLSDIDIVVTKANTVTLNGVILNPPGNNSVMISLMPPESNLTAKFIRKDGEYHPKGGRFEIHGVAPGAYVLVANSSNGKRLSSARQQLMVTGAYAGDIVLTLSPGVDLRGEVRVEGQSNLDLSTLCVALRSREQGGGASRVTRDGLFTIPNVVPNAYVLSVTGLPSNYYLKSVSLGGLGFSPFKVDLNGGVPGTLSLVISAGAGRISGRVMDDQQPAGGVLVALVPAERERADLYKSAKTNTDGAFRLEAVTPGDYKLFAWGNVATGTYQDPEFLERFEDRGQRVTIGENSSQSIQLNLIPSN